MVPTCPVLLDIQYSIFSSLGGNIFRVLLFLVSDFISGFVSALANVLFRGLLRCNARGFGDLMFLEVRKLRNRLFSYLVDARDGNALRGISPCDG